MCLCIKKYLQIFTWSVYSAFSGVGPGWITRFNTTERESMHAIFLKFLVPLYTVHVSIKMLVVFLNNRLLIGTLTKSQRTVATNLQN